MRSVSSAQRTRRAHVGPGTDESEIILTLVASGLTACFPGLAPRIPVNRTRVPCRRGLTG
jgi:hypothetical protein